jgi:hypothetical protein
MVESLVGQQPGAILLDDTANVAQASAMPSANLADKGLDAFPQAEFAAYCHGPRQLTS